MEKAIKVSVGMGGFAIHRVYSSKLRLTNTSRKGSLPPFSTSILNKAYFRMVEIQVVKELLQGFRTI